MFCEFVSQNCRKYSKKVNADDKGENNIGGWDVNSRLCSPEHGTHTKNKREQENTEKQQPFDLSMQSTILSIRLGINGWGA